MQVTPLELAAGYAVFANGGFRVQPYFIDRIENAAGTGRVARRRRALPARNVRGPAATPAGAGDAAAAQPVPQPLTDQTALSRTSDTLRGGAELSSAGVDLADRVISPQNDYLMTDMMMDVIKRGTGRRAMALGRTDIAGKTGTTNEAKDTWFNGFTPRPRRARCGWGTTRSDRSVRARRARRRRCRSG